MVEYALSATNGNVVRDQHVSAILRTILGGPIARKQLAATTKISFGTITRLANSLIENGYLEETASAKPASGRSAGRPEVPLVLRENGGKMLIGTQIQARVVTVDAFTMSGRRVHTSERGHTNSSRARVIETAVDLTKQMIERAGGETQILGVGISTGGHVDFTSGTLLSSPILGWRRTDLRGLFQRDIARPVVVDNSVRSLAIERLLWSAWAAPNMLVVVVAGAISSAVIINGALYRGSSATAGDISHFPVLGTVHATTSKPCDCGLYGCASTCLTDAALHEQAVGAGLVAEDTDWSAAYADSPELNVLRQERARLLGSTLGHLISITDPDVVVLAGRIGSRSDVHECLRQARATTSTRPAGQLVIKHWKVTEHEWSAGAAALLLDDFLAHPTAYDPALL